VNGKKLITGGDKDSCNYRYRSPAWRTAREQSERIVKSEKGGHGEKKKTVARVEGTVAVGEHRLANPCYKYKHPGRDREKKKMLKKKEGVKSKKTKIKTSALIVKYGREAGCKAEEETQP